MFVENTILRWGGLLETVYGTCSNTKEVPKKIKILKRKINRLERSKTIEDIQHSIHFTKMERNYLNSPLLDEIFDTIFSVDPIETSIIYDKLLAFLFYSERGLINYKEVMEIVSSSASIKILKYIIENKKIENINMENCIMDCYYGTHNDIENFMLFCLEKIDTISDDIVGILSVLPENSLEKMLDKINCISAEKLLFYFSIGDTREEKIKMILKKFPNVSMERTLKNFVGDDWIFPGNIGILLDHGYCCEDDKLLKDIFLSLFDLRTLPINILSILKNKYRDIVELERLLQYLFTKKNAYLVEFIEESMWNEKELIQGINMLSGNIDSSLLHVKDVLKKKLSNTVRQV